MVASYKKLRAIGAGHWKELIEPILWVPKLAMPMFIHSYIAAIDGNMFAYEVYIYIYILLSYVL